MINLRTPQPCFIFFSLLYHSAFHNQKKLSLLATERLGAGSEFMSDFCPMKNYYSKEMGDEKELKRFFYIGYSLREREDFVLEKLWAQEQEVNFLNEKKRTLNLDVGVLNLENIQLATSKNFTHRVYLHSKIYSDLTLIYQNNSQEKGFKALPWTYPDYIDQKIQMNFLQAREVLKSKLESALHI